MSSVFLFGAGASYGSGHCHPESPPLGNGDNGLFKKLQEMGGVAACISPTLADKFINNFEDGMAEFYSVFKLKTPAFLREMSLYFSYFEPLDGNLYKELIKVIASTKQQVVLATTNYDLLIEHSICQSGYEVAYHALPVPETNFSVLKIHGSCNFLPDLRGGKFSGFSINTTNAPNIEAPVKIAQPLEIVEFCREEDVLAPAISMYSKGKEVKFCNEFILQQQQWWLKSVAKAKNTFIIGLRVNAEDTHIWQALASSNSQLLYVGFEKEEFESWKKENGRKNAHWIAQTFDKAMPIIKNYFK